MFEYKVIPAPRRGQRAKGVKGAGGRFATAMEQILNEMGADGWQYQRAETLPADERHGVMRKKVEEYHNVLVFRRTLEIEEKPAESPSRPFFVAPPTPPSAPTLGPAAVETPKLVEVDTPAPDNVPEIRTIDDEPPAVAANSDTDDADAEKKPAKKAAPKKTAAKKTPAKRTVTKKKPAAKPK